MVPPYVCTEGNGGLYEQFHVDVEGSGQLRENAHVFDRLAAEYNQHKFALKDALNEIQVTYTGQGAEAMRGAFEPLIESVGQGYDLCRRSAVLLTDQGGGFDTAQAKIQKPVDVPSKPWLNSLTPWDTAYDKAVEHNSQIDSGNQQAFAKYADTSLNNWAQAPTFESGNAGFGTITVTEESRQPDPGDPEHVVHNRRPGGDRPRGTIAGPGLTTHNPPTPVQGPPLNPGRPDDGPGGHGDAEGPPDSGPDGRTDAQDYVAPADGGSNGPRSLSYVPGSGPGPTGGFSSVDGNGPGGSASRGLGVGVVRPGETAASGRGAPVARGGSGGFGAGTGGAAGRREEDQEHEIAAYLVNDENGGQIVGELPVTSPAVIGG